MTVEERILRLEETVGELKTTLTDLHDAFLKPGPDGSPPLRDRFSRIVIAAERGEWAAKWGVRTVLALATLGISVRAGFISWIAGFFGGGR